MARVWSTWSGIDAGPLRRDTAAAGLLLVAATVAVALSDQAAAPDARWAGLDGRALLSTALLLVAVALRRRMPAAAAVGAFAGFVVVGNATFGSLLVVAVVALWLALYGVVAHAGVVTVTMTAAGCLPAVALGAAVTAEPPSAGAAVALAVPVAAGLTVRAVQGRRRVRGVRAERLSADEEQQAVLLERARIARELHDVAAHHLSAIVVSAGAALRVLDRDPAMARRTLDLVAVSARRTSEAMQRMLGAMAEPGICPPVDGLPLRPDLGHLPDLVRLVELSGCQVLMTTSGDLAGVPPDAALTAFRIVQEGLTNVLRHGAATAAQVRVSRTAAGLDVVVTDTGPADGIAAPVTTGSGHGLIGIAERVALFGGTATCGPDPDGGWSVRASIPLG